MPLTPQRIACQQICGYDRLSLWFDRTDLQLPKKELRKHCHELIEHVGQMPMNLRWKYKLIVLQPASSFFTVLKEAVGREISVVIAELEITSDFITRTAKDAAALCSRFLAAARVPHQRQPVMSYENTFYYARRTNGNGKRGKVFVVYADRASKIASEHCGRPCLHVEYRITGSSTLATLGIASIDDLERFDHESFWCDRVRMYSLPSVTRLGQILFGQGHSRVSDEALRKRARALRKAHTLNGNFVLQNAARECPSLCRSLHSTSMSTWGNLQTIDRKDPK